MDKVISRTISEIDKVKNENLELSDKLNKARAENERLKKQYNCYACDSCGGKEDYINMKRHTENAIKTVHKYRQALQEIRDIVREETETRMLFADEKSFCDFCKIQAKINEVIGEK